MHGVDQEEVGKWEGAWLGLTQLRGGEASKPEVL